MPRTRLSVAFTLAAIAVTVLPVRRSSNSSVEASENASTDPSLEALETILETVGEGEALAARKGTWKCSMKCESHFGRNHPDFVAPGCPQELQRVIKKDYNRCEAKTHSEAQTAIINHCNSLCMNVSRQCLCKHDFCRFVD